MNGGLVMKKYLPIGCLAILLLLLIGGGIAGWLAFYNPGFNRDFDPALLAGAETRMWQAYYAKDKEALGMELLTVMHEQFGLSYKNAYDLTMVLGRATMRFASGQSDYRETVLPGLVEFYTRTKELGGGKWNPQEAAQAELDWWVARRTPGEDSPEQVGAKIAHLYALLYGKTNEDIERAGLLRAQAAALRDQGQQNADWATIEALLLESYTALHTGVAS
jgi:hypothetical protein